MNKIMGRVTSRRADFCAVTAAHLTAKNALVVLEDLKTRTMTASAAGTLAAPGSRVVQKRGPSRAILEEGMAPPRTRPGQRSPIHGHTRGEGPSRIHIAAVLRWRLRHRDKPRKPSGLPVPSHRLRSHRARRRECSGQH
jgi:hypothetical protein